MLLSGSQYDSLYGSLFSFIKITKGLHQKKMRLSQCLCGIHRLWVSKPTQLCNLEVGRFFVSFTRFVDFCFIVKDLDEYLNPV